MVSDAQLHPYLLRLAVIAQQLTQIKEEEVIPPPQINLPKLPKGTLKALMTYFKSVALSEVKQLDPSLKRTYLAFYTQLLNLKSSNQSQFDELGQQTEFLILKFTACSSKMLANKDQLQQQEKSFVNLLKQTAKKLGGSAHLESALAQRESDIGNFTVKKKSIKFADADDVTLEMQRLLNISPILYEKDLKRERVDLGEVARFYELCGNLELAKSFATPPAQQHLQVPPDNVLEYLTLFCELCILADKNDTTLFKAKTQSVMRFVCRLWLVKSSGFVVCLLHAFVNLFRKGDVQLEALNTVFNYAEHVLNTPFSEEEVQFGLNALTLLREDLINLVEQVSSHILDQDAPKFGPVLHALMINLPDFARVLNLQDFELASPLQLKKIEDSIIKTAKQDYLNHSPADFDQFLNLVQRITLNAKRLQKRYKHKLLNAIPLTRVVCKTQLRLFETDFTNLFTKCKLDSMDWPFESMVQLHEELLVLESVSDQLNLHLHFHFEELMFKFFQNWANQSTERCMQWVKPAISNDTLEPVDREELKMYSSAIKDLFSSFYALISLIEKMQWKNELQLSRLLTTVVGGISSSLCSYAKMVNESFADDMALSTNHPTLPPLLKTKEQEEQWLSYAKGATAQAAAAVMARSTTQRAAPDFDFNPMAGVKLNNIAAAYQMLQNMESQLNSDAVSQQLREYEKSINYKPAMVKYLFNVTIIGASGIKHNNQGLYLTLIDHDSRKQLGKTGLAAGSSSPKWNESFEFEILGTRPKLLRATVWSSGSKESDHAIVGRVMLKLDAKQYAKQEYGMQLKWIDLESNQGKLHVMFSVDQQFDDIRFHFGKSLRFLKRTQDHMVSMIVSQFSVYIKSLLSRQTLKEVTGQSSFSSVQTQVSQLQRSFNSWLGKSLNNAPPTPSVQELVDKSLDPLYDYLNKNFATLAQILTIELRTEVLSETWDVVLDVLESLILPQLDITKTTQTPLNSAEMEALYMWLSSLREFFHSDGAGPTLERLQNQNYQQIMTIPVYYDLPVSNLKQESEKEIRNSLRSLATSTEMLARQNTVMAHRNRSVIEHQAVQLAHAQRNSPRLDDIILRILRLHNETQFIEQHLRLRDRLMQKELTERALQGSLFTT